jgi:hypothetical protein
MKLTKKQLKDMVLETLQDKGPSWKAGEGKVPNVDELAEWYWKALMSGNEVFLSQDLASVWIPLAKGEDLKNIEIPSHTAAEWVKQMDAESVRHYAKGVQNALIQVFKDVLSDKSKIVDPMHGGTDYQSGEKKIAAHQLQKIFDVIGVNPAFARQIPGFEDKYAWKGAQQEESKAKITKSQLAKIIREEIAGYEGTFQDPEKSQQARGSAHADINQEEERRLKSREVAKKTTELYNAIKKLKSGSESGKTEWWHGDKATPYPRLLDTLRWAVHGGDLEGIGPGNFPWVKKGMSLSDWEESLTEEEGVKNENN